MTATEKLRRLLDERGVKWSTTKGCDSDSITTVHVDGRFGGTEWEAFELADGTFQVTAGIYDELTPEQFIAVTLGRGECHAIISDNLNESEGMGDAWADCSECGHLLYVLTDPNSEPPNYCPSCGRKVVSE